MTKRSAETAEIVNMNPTDSQTDLSRAGAVEISGALRLLLADIFALYMKTKNFHWHMTGSQFRDYHLLLDERADQIFAMTDTIAERARKTGGSSLRSISDIVRHQRLNDNNEEGMVKSSCLCEKAEGTVPPVFVKPAK